MLKDFFSLVRFKNQTGTLLLFLPCLCGLKLSNGLNFWQIGFFFFSSFIMRSFGCIANDICDQNIDRKVDRTKCRPLASGRINTKSAIKLMIFFGFIGFLLFLNLSNVSKVIVLFFFPAIFLYPLAKRFTHFPQIFLGVIFSSGVIVSFFNNQNSVSLEVLFLYLFFLFFTVFYDTIYAIQDEEDDRAAFVKSIPVFFGKNTKIFLLFISIVCYIILSQIVGYLKSIPFLFISLIMLAISSKKTGGKIFSSCVLLEVLVFYLI